MQSVADNYLNVKIDYDPRLIGRRVLVDIINYTAEGLHGKVLDVR
jgi:hypothetical protein